MFGQLIERIRSGELKWEFYLSQIALAGFALYWWFRPTEGDSKFRSFEGEKPKPAGSGKRALGAPGAPQGNDDSLANAKMKIKRPLQLEGIRIDGAPHEILGLREDASPADVNRAYRELMNRYHPDKVGRPGSREWNDAQKIAEALNRAKEELLKKH